MTKQMTGLPHIEESFNWNRLTRDRIKQWKSWQVMGCQMAAVEEDGGGILTALDCIYSRCQWVEPPGWSPISWVQQELVVPN
jgi:hypothetical protein